MMSVMAVVPTPIPFTREQATGQCCLVARRGVPMAGRSDVSAEHDFCLDEAFSFMRVFAGTSAFYALRDRGDADHARIRSVWPPTG